MEPSLITEQGSNSLRRMTKDVISMMNNALDAYVRKDVKYPSRHYGTRTTTSL